MIETSEALLKTKKIDTFFVLLVAQDGSTFLPLLENLFSNIFIASTQAESLELFDTHPIDLVIIDTQASRYHWLTLVHQFRLKVYDISIALIVDMLTCNDTDSFILADVTSHFFKPLNPKIINFELHDLMHKIYLKKESKIFQDLKERRKIQSLAFYTIRRIIEEIPSPIFAYNANEKILFYNKNIIELFEIKQRTIPEMMHVWNIEDLFENLQKEAHFGSLNHGKSFHLHYVYAHQETQKIFIPTKFSIALENDEEPFDVIVLTDITPLLLQNELFSTLYKG
ncbi:hypothetical protein [Sulfurospirillum barnesii]|uniref:PAS domain-containing protein n=1 Tax=Sulfurospirillum barnesii (strain ATCC 700032 / DSM 10660 / SES-3) TaxID=760154 RepID=I3XYR5_SULBS|nr:hypothetical protein [Sulfurospirillum barnesii]AFL69089.1 hypothetical protein Sulba_1808 [Sulfurospirillum barnesii SES-3]